MRSIILVLVSFFIMGETSAQTIADALRYARTNNYGSARFMGTSGSMGAIGADISTFSINPAGIGAFWKSEVSGTASVLVNNSTMSLADEVAGEKTNFGAGLNHGGIVLTRSNLDRNWMSVSFGFAYNKSNSLLNNFEFSGATKGSIVDRFRSLASGVHPDNLDNFEAGLAYETGAIFDLNDDLNYEDDIAENVDGLINKNQIVNERGNLGALDFTLGGNYKNFLLVGATLSFPVSDFGYKKYYRELDTDNNFPTFDHLKYDEFLRSEGGGFQLKLGGIVKPTRNLRLGLAYHSPSVIEVEENWSTSMTYGFLKDGSVATYTKDSPEGNFKYRIFTPMKFLGSVGTVIGKHGFVNLEADFIDYGSSRFDLTAHSENSDDAGYERELNDEIKKQYTSAVNLRLGGELALDAFRLRGGIRANGSPYEKTKSEYDLGYSLGLGFRMKKYYVDVAYDVMHISEGYSPYNITGASSTFLTQKTNKRQLALTLGMKL